MPLTLTADAERWAAAQGEMDASTADAVAAEHPRLARVDAAMAELRSALAGIADIADPRGLAVARTKLDEAQMWIAHAVSEVRDG